MKPFSWEFFQIILPRNYSLALKPSVVIPRWCSQDIPWQRRLSGQIHGRDGIGEVEFPNVFSLSHTIFCYLLFFLSFPLILQGVCIYFLCGYGLSRFKVTNHGPVEHLFKGYFYKGKGLIKASLLNLAKYVTVLFLFSFNLEQAFCSLLFYCLSEQLKQTFV